jgi:hypothetical protein
MDRIISKAELIKAQINEIEFEASLANEFNPAAKQRLADRRKILEIELGELAEEIEIAKAQEKLAVTLRMLKLKA